GGPPGRRHAAGRPPARAAQRRGGHGSGVTRVPAVRILLVDDHYLVRVGLSSIVALESDMAVCAEASSGEEALAVFRRLRPDVTLMDQRLPGMSGAEATHALREEFPEARVIILSTYSTD